LNKSNIKGKRYFFTGGTSGLGKAAVLSLLDAGAEVLVASRSNEKSEALRREAFEKKDADLTLLNFVSCDLSSFASIRAACNELKEEYGLLDGIINNAGVWSFSREETKDGIEKTLQVNLLAPHLIVNELIDRVKPGGRIVQTASALHQGKFNLTNPEFEKSYSGFRAYRQSKLGIILLTRWWAKEFSDREIFAYSQHPGLVSTQLGREGNWLVQKFFDWFGKSPEKGAKTLLYVIKEDTKELKNGAYFKNEKPKKTDTKVSRSMEWAKKVNDFCADYIKKHGSVG
jgi:NAD(P)-dependent dehydrogenase (short-subunit alcohol dehydrogenase family)